jgi:hypothetical protein
VVVASDHLQICNICLKVLFFLIKICLDGKFKIILIPNQVILKQPLSNTWVNDAAKKSLTVKRVGGSATTFN